MTKRDNIQKNWISCYAEKFPPKILLLYDELFD